MRWVIILIMLVGIGLGGGCSSVQSLQNLPRGEDQVVMQREKYESTVSDIGTKRDFSNAPQGTWIFPGKVEISNMRSGARAEMPISVHNGNDEDTQFSIYYEDLPSVPEGYQKAPEDASKWIFTDDFAPMLSGDEIRDILVVLEIPQNVSMNVTDWGFLVIVQEATQEGLVKVRNASKWLVHMRR